MRFPASTENSILEMFSKDEAIRILPPEVVSEPLMEASWEESLNASQRMVVPSSEACCAGLTESTALKVMLMSIASFASISTGDVGPASSTVIAVPIEADAVADA